jgi:hypothetical protein
VNTRVGRGVKLVGRDTAGRGIARSGDLKVDALGVELGTTDVVGRVQGKDLVAENIVAGLDVGGNLDLPGKSVLDQIIRGPLEDMMLASFLIITRHICITTQGN